MPAKPSSATDANDSGASLVWGTSSFEPGGDVGLVARNTVALIARDNPSTRERLWRFVADDAPLDDILDELSSTGLKALPDFGIVKVEGDAVRVVARGRTVITAELVSGDRHDIDASGVRTWIEEVVADVVGLTITLSPLDGDPPTPSSEAFEVLAGSVPAQSVSRRFDVEDQHADEASRGWTTHADRGDEDAAVEPDADDPEPAEPEAVEPEVVEPEAVEPEADDPEPAEPEAVEPEAAEPEVAEEPDARPPHADDLGLEMVEPDDEGDGDSWFTDHAEDSPSSAIPPQPGVDDSPAGAGPADPQPASPQPSGPPVVEAQPASPQPSGPPVVEAQPASPQPSGPPSGPGAGGPPPPEATVVVGPADGPVRGPATSIFDADMVEDGAVPTLPPDDGAARGPVSDVGATAVPDAAHVHGVLAFSNGERINVDRSVLIGRNPKVAGAVAGGLPHIMKFEGPGQGLSRTHAEVRIENGEMLLEDLQSTNGTEVQLPGQQRRRLRGGEPVVIVPGTLIDFGDELHCTVETAG